MINQNYFSAYVQVFSALIVIIAGAFVITIIYRSAISFFHTHLWNFKGRGMARCCWVPATDVSRLAPEDPAGLPELNNDANNNNTGQYLMST